MLPLVKVIDGSVLSAQSTVVYEVREAAQHFKCGWCNEEAVGDRRLQEYVCVTENTSASGKRKPYIFRPSIILERWLF